jgi:hypothetical protein
MRALTFAVVISIGFLACAHAASAGDVIIRPNTRGAADTLKVLKQALIADRMNSHAWTTDNPTLDRFYAEKAREVEFLIRRLENGQAVMASAVERAMNNRQAVGLSGEFWDVPDIRSY